MRMMIYVTGSAKMCQNSIIVNFNYKLVKSACTKLHKFFKI